MATQSDGEFQEWLGKVMDSYTKLNDEQRNFTIDCLIACSGSSQLCHLHAKTSVLLHRDFLKLLPPELREHLLSFLDGESLLTCCGVSKTWNDIISSSSRIWLRVCSASGLIVNKNIHNGDAAYWKSFFLKMARRRHQMKNFKCFTTKTYDRNLRRVTAVYYHNGKIATASDSKVIQIWNCVDDSCILTLRTDSSISTIKFDDNYIVAASYLGHIVSWDAVSGKRLLEYMRHSGVIFTLDYSTKLNIIVSGSADCLIKIWGLKTGFLYKRLSDHSCWVLKVILAPYPAEKESNLQERHLLLSMDKTAIVVRYLTFMTKCRSPDKLCMCTLYSISLGHPDDSGLFTPGLHFDGDFLYFPKETLDNRGSASLCKWDLKRKRMVSEIDLNLKVKALLGVGKKYIVVLTTWRQHTGNLPNFIVMDKENKEKVAVWHVPPSQPTTPDLAQLCLGEKDWLDGLDGKNDQGVLLTAAIDENCVYVLKWVTESDDMITCDQ